MKVTLKMPKEYGRCTAFSVWNKFGEPDYIEIPNNCNIKSVTIEFERNRTHANNRRGTRKR